jgi:dihydroorotate dehydrogenase electron transfer subunit
MTYNKGPHRKNTRLRTCAINEILDETPTIKTFFFKNEMAVFGGQFVMVWIPGVDEIPMSVSYTGELNGITVAKVGDATEKLHKFQVGSKLGIRGPYGNGFDISNAKRLLAVAGGCGSAPIGPVLNDAIDTGKKMLFVIGARTSNELLFKQRAMELGIEVDISTDDGSEGHHGFVTERVAELLSSEKFDLILTCGPEIMMKAVVELGQEKNVSVQASLERYMKCGIGICDSCSINGLQVCRDGPVFDGEILSKLREFGKSQRDACGRKIEI